ncbi:unnamed protein product [Closterium sp. Naga37s-1]|nr:unnamed protein product [Closterium sp. Naga37s-1]
MCKRPDFPADITGDDSIGLEFPAQPQSGWTPGAHGAAAAAHLTSSQLAMPPFTLHYPTASPAAASHAAASQHLDWLACGPAFLSPVSLLPAFPSPGPLLAPPPLLDASNPASDMTARLSASHGLTSPRGAWTSAANPAAMRGSPPSPAAATATSALAAAQTAAAAATATAGAAAGGGAGAGVGAGMGAGMGTGAAPWMSFMGPSLAMGSMPQGFLVRSGAAQAVGHDAGRIPVMSEKKHKRIVSNRASAKRSRQRRQQRLEELEVMAAHLQVDGADARKGLADATARLAVLQHENKNLLEQVAELQRLMQLANQR